MSRTRATTPATAVVIGLATLVLAACNVSVNRTLAADTVAEKAEDTLEDQIGQRPEIDCGEDAVPFENDTVVECVLTDPVTTTQFDTTVTISEVDGDSYHLNVQVAAEPRS